MTGPEDRPFSLAEIVLSLEARQPGSYASTVETVDDLADIVAVDLGMANRHMNIQACRDAALARIQFALSIAGPPRGIGDADDDSEPKPREPVGGGGGWV